MPKPLLRARHDEQIGQSIEIGQVLFRHVAEKAHGGRIARELDGAPCQPAAIVAVAGHDMDQVGKLRR